MQIFTGFQEFTAEHRKHLIASVHGVNYFGRGSLKGSSYISYIKYDAIAKDLLNGSLNYVPYLKGVYKKLTSAMVNYGSIKDKYAEKNNTK